MKLFAYSVGALCTAIIPTCFSSCSNDITDSHVNDIRIIASNATPDETRSMVDGIDLSSGVVGLLWTPGDELGVFAQSGSQAKFIKANQSDNEAKSVFVAESNSSMTPRYAYYPYDAVNEGRPATQLEGIVPELQSMDDGTIAGDYKYGTANSTTPEGYEFEFRHIFSLVKVDLDVTNSELAGKTLSSIELTVTRDGQPVNIVGSFTFNATNGSYTYIDGSNHLLMKWNNGKFLEEAVTGYVSLFPEIRIGDQLAFRITTDKTIASFSVTSKVDFRRESIYNFPLTLSKFDVTYTDSGNDPTPSISGSFICASYNVDGLPSIVNSDGPGSRGTTLLGQRINSDNKWDFFCVSEDFEYDKQLTAALSNYSHGKYRGTVGLVSEADTDGLNLFWKNNGLGISDETFVEYNAKEGDLFSGANTCIKKGFRYYLATLPDGTEIDVYITHMNTYSGSSIDENSNKYVGAVHAQLIQVRDYMIENLHKNNRPAIFMGDTNMRYTRHKIKEYLIDPINADSNLEIIDPWVDLAWNNDFSSVGGDNYPAYGSKSLMVSDATGTNADTDIIIPEADGGLQKGEVVDKVFYINCKDAKTQIKAKTYLRDVSFKKDNGSPLADHYPIVIEFDYTRRN